MYGGNGVGQAHPIILTRINTTNDAMASTNQGKSVEPPWIRYCNKVAFAENAMMSLELKLCHEQWYIEILHALTSLLCGKKIHVHSDPMPCRST
jgi:hypothetical protein